MHCAKYYLPRWHAWKVCKSPPPEQESILIHVWRWKFFLWKLRYFFKLLSFSYNSKSSGHIVPCQPVRKPLLTYTVYGTCYGTCTGHKWQPGNRPYNRTRLTQGKKTKAHLRFKGEICKHFLLWIDADLACRVTPSAVRIQANKSNHPSPLIIFSSSTGTGTNQGSGSGSVSFWASRIRIR